MENQALQAHDGWCWNSWKNRRSVSFWNESHTLHANQRAGSQKRVMMSIRYGATSMVVYCMFLYIIA